MSRWSLELLDQVKDIAEEAGRAILKFTSRTTWVSKPSGSEPFTQADLASHDIITKAFKQLTPDIPILSEEGHTLDGEVDTFWCVDPWMAPKSSLKRMMNSP